MGTNVTLGGERLGSGKKQKVYLHGYERSTHDLSYLWRSTMSAGTLVPFMKYLALPGDTFDINLDADVKTHPTVGPLFGSYKVQLDLFVAPIRLYNAALHNNEIGIGLRMADIKFPLVQMQSREVLNDGTVTDVSNSQINPSSIAAYFGIRGIGISNEAAAPKNRNFNAIPFLAYWEIYKQYYSNKPEEIGAVIHVDNTTINETVDSITIDAVAVPEAPASGAVAADAGMTVIINFTGAEPALEDIIVSIGGVEYNAHQLFETVPVTGAGTITGEFNSAIAPTTIQYWKYRATTDVTEVAPTVVTFDLNNIDQMRKNILAAANTSTPFMMNEQNLEPYKWISTSNEGIPYLMNSQEGLGIKTYQSDLHNNWMNTEWIDGSGGISEITAVDTSDGNFQIDALILAKKVYNYLNRVAVSGGTYDDWLDVTYDHERFTRAESPIYMGGLSKELVFQEVVSNSDSGDQPLGTLAGKGIMGQKHKGGKAVIKIDEPSYIIGIVSLTPRIDYSQGNEWDMHLETMDDLHKPALDEIGFQELITEQLAWYDTYWDETNQEWVQRSAGKQPAWINYMTEINKVFGNFAVPSNEMFMTLNRRYEAVADGENFTIGDLTTYVDPVKCNYIFANTNLDAMNFWVQIRANVEARRKMSAKVIPNL